MKIESKPALSYYSCTECYSRESIQEIEVVFHNAEGLIVSRIHVWLCPVHREKLVDLLKIDKVKDPELKATIESIHDSIITAYNLGTYNSLTQRKLNSALELLDKLQSLIGSPE